MSEAEFESFLNHDQEERDQFLDVYTNLKENGEWRWRVVPVVFLFPPPAREGRTSHFDEHFSVSLLLRPSKGT